jgi:hypothetical protein
MKNTANVMTGKFHWRLMRLLLDGHKLTSQQGADMTGANRAHMDNVFKAMRDAGLVYVCGYQSAGRTRARVYAVKDKSQEDVENPPRIDNATRCSRHRNNKKALSGEVRLGVWGL